MAGLPSSARVVIVGGGIGGLSAAWHLAQLGVSDVVVLERAELSSGTTWHSTGNMETYRDDPLIFEMVRYAAATYPRISRDSGQDIGWRSVGRVMYTDREDRWQHMRTLPELGRARGIDIEVLTPGDVAARLPIVAAEGLLGGIWVPSDARVNPTDAVTAFARLARARGVRIHEHVPVEGIAVRGGSVRAVVTGDGDIACDVVVLAAGLWSGDLAASAGLSLPLHALEHQYLITKPFGVDRNLPLFLSYDDQMYGREEVGGLLFGSLDDDAIPVSTRDLPQDFASCLLNERWSQFEPYMATAMRRFPCLREAEVRLLLNGPESFTPDGNMLLGPVPGAGGLYAACGFNSNGMALAPAAGRFIAEWIVEGAPSADVAPLDVRRFAAVQAATGYLRERVTEIPGYYSRLHAPDDDYRTARNVRRSPLHAELAAAGARFVSVAGWERAAWLQRGPDDRDMQGGVAAETAAGGAGVLAIDRSADANYLLTGADAAGWLAATALRLAGEGAEAQLSALPGRNGEVEALVRVLVQAPDRVLLTATPDQETRLAEWLRRADLPESVRVLDVTGAHGCIELHGPGRGAILGALGIDSDASVVRHEDPANDSTVLTVPATGAVGLWRELLAPRAGHRPVAGGHFAEQALRIGRGVPAFGREITPFTAVAGLPGLTSRLARRRLPAAFSSPMSPLGFGSQEVLLESGRPVGELTSRVRLPGWPETLALGLLDPAAWRGGPVTVVADGRTWPLATRTTSWLALIERPAASR